MTTAQQRSPVELHSTICRKLRVSKEKMEKVVLLLSTQA